MDSSSGVTDGILRSEGTFEVGSGVMSANILKTPFRRSGAVGQRAIEQRDHVANVGGGREFALARFGRDRHVKVRGDPLEQRHRLRRFLLRQEIDLEIEMRPALALPGEGRRSTGRWPRERRPA
jgi:hypothetical protein